MFNYGTITVETAGEQKDNFAFPNLPHPELVGKKLLELSRAVETEKPAAQPVAPILRQSKTLVLLHHRHACSTRPEFAPLFSV